MGLVIYPGKRDKNNLKILIVGEYVGEKVELAQDFSYGVTKAIQFLNMNPIGKPPVLETPDGTIFKSHAIARYVARRGQGANSSLFGSSLIEQARVDQWIDFAASEIDLSFLGWFGTRMRPYVLHHSEEAAISNVKEALGGLNLHLASNTYLVGHCVTLADIIMICDLLLGFTKLMSKSFTSEFPHIERYFWTLVNQPNFKKVLGEVKQTTNNQLPANDSNDPQVLLKPKITPLDLLPPTKMILDKWKRLYSLNKINSIKELWNMYDPKGYSLWFCENRFKDGIEVTNSCFMSINFASFFNYMDVTRKYAFGRMLVIGSKPPYKLKGVWLFRGQEIPRFLLKRHQFRLTHDIRAYHWHKVDILDAAQTQRVTQMIMIQEQHTFEGEAVVDAKCFM